MVITEDIYLPTEEEINHKELPITCNYLLSSAMWLGKYCDNQCKEFMLCRLEEGDPRKCIKDSQKVTDCGLEFFRKVKKTCKDELDWYTKCLDFSGSEPEFKRCRREQAIFDSCMTKNGFERARFGHFQMIRVHNTERPKPKLDVPIFEDASTPFDFNKEVANAPPRGPGSRFLWNAFSQTD